MTRTIVLALAAFSFCALPPRCVSQDAVPVIYLSPSETAKAKQAAEVLTRAYDHNNRARTAWQNFRQSYQAAHPELPGLKFASDLKLAFALKNLPDPLWREAAVIELSAEEREKAESLQRQIAEAKRALDEAKQNWLDYRCALVLDHFAGGTSGGEYKLSSGKTVILPDPWASGPAFTPDFRVTVPFQP